MAKCVKTEFDRMILCAGSMTDYIEIIKRSGGTTEIGQGSEIPMEFESVINFAGYIEAVKDTFRFNGVSTPDQSENNFTHAGYIPFDQTVYELDINTFFVKLTRNRNRYFKLKGIKNYGEQDEYLQLRLAETGFSDLKASHG